MALEESSLSEANEQQKTLHDQILEELKKMDSVLILSDEQYEPLLYYLRELGEIVVDYKTRQEEVKRTWPLKAKIRLIPLCSLDEIKDTFAKNPEIGQPSSVKEIFLVYQRSWPAEMILRYGEKESKRDFQMYERVLVSEIPVFTKEGTMDSDALLETLKHK